MRVLHVLDRSLPDLSGYSIRSKYILEFQKRAIEPLALTSPKYSLNYKFESINGIEYYRSNNGNHSWASALPFLRERMLMNVLKKDIFRLLDKYRVDIIHAHSPSLCGMPAQSAARQRKIPFVYEARALWEDAAVDLGKFKEQSFKYRLSRYLESRLFEKADAVVVICDNLKDEVCSRINKKEVYVVANGVDTARFFPQPKDEFLAAKYNLGNKTVIGFIGSFFKFEGLDYLIQSIPQVSRKIKDVVFLIVGAGVEQSSLKDLAGRLMLADEQVIFAGRVPHSDILKYYSVMDILVYPRRRKRITDLVTPLKPLEAMAAQKCVLASDVSGLSELIQDGKTGILFKAGDICDLTEKIIFLAQNQGLQASLGAAARSEVIKSRDWSNIVPKYLDIYKTVLGGKN